MCLTEKRFELGLFVFVFHRACYHGDQHWQMQTELFVLMQLSEPNVTVVGFERTARGIRDETDATLVNRKTETKLWTAAILAGVAFAEVGWGPIPG